MERIREAIKLAKQTRDVAGVQRVLSPRPVAQPPYQNNAEATDEKVEQAAMPVARTNRQHLEENRIVGHLHDNVATIPFEILRTRIIQEMTAQNWSVLVITSPTQGCGKTVTAINLALSMSKLQGRSVYLVDLDLRKPAISNYLGLPRMPSFNDFREGRASASETLFNLDIAGPNLTVACNWDATDSPAEAMASHHIAEYFSFLRSRQEHCIIIVDLPPLLVSDDVMSVLPHANCCVLTVAENMSTSHDIANSEDLLATTNFLGCVYNKSREVNKNLYY